MAATVTASALGRWWSRRAVMRRLCKRAGGAMQENSTPAFSLRRCRVPFGDHTQAAVETAILKTAP